jgi:hypothetical protein
MAVLSDLTQRKGNGGSTLRGDQSPGAFATLKVGFLRIEVAFLVERTQEGSRKRNVLCYHATSYPRGEGHITCAECTFENTEAGCPKRNRRAHLACGRSTCKK